MLTSTRRRRVSGLRVACTQRTHSHRAIGVRSCHRARIFVGASARAAARSSGTSGSGQSVAIWTLTWATSPELTPATRWRSSSTRIQWPRRPSGSTTVLKPWPATEACTATCPRDGSRSLAASGNRTRVVSPMVDSSAAKLIVACGDDPGSLGMPRPLPSASVSRLGALITARHTRLNGAEPTAVLIREMGQSED